MLITIYHSKRDINGNRYHAIELSRLGQVLTHGRFDYGDINYSDLYSKGIEVTEKELPIKEFKRYVKDLPYFGYRWEDIKEGLWID
jgi:hypothetical protein